LNAYLGRYFFAPKRFSSSAIIKSLSCPSVFEFPAREAVSARIISEEFLDQERREIGDLLFSQLYECNFLPPGNQWYNESMIALDDYEVLD